MNARLFFLFLVCGMFCRGQQSEFKLHDNGLIYSEQAVSKLRHIVDSLNLKFKRCDLSKKFVSVSQCRAHFIRIENKQAAQAKKDIDAGISFPDFKKKYPKATIEENLVVTKGSDNWDSREYHWISSLQLGNTPDYSIHSGDVGSNEGFTGPFKGKWIGDYHDQTNYSAASVEAFYFPEEFSAKPIPQRYAEMIQYADCLVDTTAQVFTANAKDDRRFDRATMGKAHAFCNYVYDKIKQPGLDRTDYASYFNDDVYKELGNDDRNFAAADSATVDTAMAEPALSEKQMRRQMRKEVRKMKRQLRKHRKDMLADIRQYDREMLKPDPQRDAYIARRQAFENSRLSRIDSLKNADLEFMPMLKAAFDEVAVVGGSFDDFEELVGRYLSKDAELQLKRSRRVVGGCSMDQSPRFHAVNIALLSAETTKWEIFLRSHLDIMNDRFDRMSDGSYAWAARQTYIKELEVLDINVPEMVFGISLRVDNAAPNHYFSSIGRTGRALAESKDALKFEEMMLGMISDTALDDFNRVMMYYMFDNYNHFLADEKRKAENVTKLKAAVATMPEYIASRVVFNKA